MEPQPMHSETSPGLGRPLPSVPVAAWLTLPQMWQGLGSSSVLTYGMSLIRLAAPPPVGCGMLDPVDLPPVEGRGVDVDVAGVALRRQVGGHRHSRSEPPDRLLLLVPGRVAPRRRRAGVGAVAD